VNDLYEPDEPAHGKGGTDVSEQNGSHR
jgi:hypothetical protein